MSPYYLLVANHNPQVTLKPHIVGVNFNADDNSHKTGVMVYTAISNIKLLHWIEGANDFALAVMAFIQLGTCTDRMLSKNVTPYIFLTMINANKVEHAC